MLKMLRYCLKWTWQEQARQGRAEPWGRGRAEIAVSPVPLTAMSSRHSPEVRMTEIHTRLSRSLTAGLQVKA